jgi:hypothetical protein
MRIANYAYRHWIAAGMTEWPTVRQAARALRIRQEEIDECAGDGHYDLTGFNCEDFSHGDYFVEATTPEVEKVWCAYWLPYSKGCYCGHHQNRR